MHFVRVDPYTLARTQRPRRKCEFRPSLGNVQQSPAGELLGDVAEVDYLNILVRFEPGDDAVEEDAAYPEIGPGLLRRNEWRGGRLRGGGGWIRSGRLCRLNTRRWRSK